MLVPLKQFQGCVVANVIELESDYQTQNNEGLSFWFTCQLIAFSYTNQSIRNGSYLPAGKVLRIIVYRLFIFLGGATKKCSADRNAFRLSLISRCCLRPCNKKIRTKQNRQPCFALAFMLLFSFSIISVESPFHATNKQTNGLLKHSYMYVQYKVKTSSYTESPCRNRNPKSMRRGQ